MEWAEDLFTLKKSAKKGRRAAAAAAATTSATTPPEAVGKPGSGTSISSLVNSMEVDLKVATDPGPAPRPRRTAGWAEEPVRSAGKSGANVIEQERFGRTVSQSSPTADDDDIPHIPDLDDIVDIADIPQLGRSASSGHAASGAETPAMAINRVATYQELNSDLLKMGAFASLDGVDMSILTRCLVAEADLHEPDEVWTWEGLFTEVAGDIHGEEPEAPAEVGVV